MKAHEVLNRYANGERDFRRANLRGQSFKGQELSGADFTEADICGTNFTNAILREANFTEAKAGLQKRWKAFSTLMSVFSVILFQSSSWGISSVVTQQLTFSPNNASSSPSPISITVGLMGLLILGAFLIFLTRKTFSSTFIFIAAVSIFPLIGGWLLQSLYYSYYISANPLAASNDFSLKLMPFLGMSLQSFTSFAVSLAFTMCGTLALSVAWNISRIQAILIPSLMLIAPGIINLPFFVSWLNYSNSYSKPNSSAWWFSLSMTFIYPILVIFLLVSAFYICWQAFSGSNRYGLVRTTVVAFGAIGGTSFRGADLTKANFTKAMLKGNDFTNIRLKDVQGTRRERETVLEWVSWHDAKGLDRARVGNSILANPVVRELLVTRNGYKKSYVDANLRTANLDGVNLEGANLTWADLSCATLRHANLSNANLLETLALDTNFTGATLTGVCLEAWNIDSHTNLEKVDCQYVYLLRDQQERRPSSGDFAPGEFTKLFQEALNTVDLIFRNGVDWKAFVAAFQTVQVDNDGTELTIQSIENKGDGVVVVRVSVPPEADKAKLHNEFNQNYDLAVKALEARYHAELKAKDEQITIYREKSADMTEILRLLANRPVTVEVNASAESKAMNDSTDKSQSVSIGGNVIGSTVNLGAISGSASNAVNQLPSAPDSAQPGIKELLVALQTAIESDTDLPEKGKASALENVKVLAEVAQDPEQPEKKGLGSQAVTFLKGAVSFLPDTAKLAEACTKLLPLITKALGLPF